MNLSRKDDMNNDLPGTEPGQTTAPQSSAKGQMWMVPRCRSLTSGTTGLGGMQTHTIFSIEFSTVFKRKTVVKNLLWCGEGGKGDAKDKGKSP